MHDKWVLSLKTMLQRILEGSKLQMRGKFNTDKRTFKFRRPNHMFADAALQKDLGGHKKVKCENKVQ